MATYPSHGDIESFKAFTQCHEDSIVVKFIQGAGNNLEAAVNTYFENPNRYDQSYQGYDESAFSQDRYGEPGNGGQAFQILPMDSSIYGHFPQSTAPTRPNSRNSNSSMRVLTDHQESGVIGGESNFGPANRGHYDLSQWALTVPDSHATEIYPDLDVWGLVRTGNVPVIMKPQNSTNLLPALLSIIGRIPLAQKLILEGPPKLDDYGASGSWWMGLAIQSPRIVDAEEEAAVTDYIEFLAETQRLIAFLQGSERLYGSVEPIQSYNLMRNVYSHESGVTVNSEAERFLRAWSIATSYQTDDAEVSYLFRSSVVINGSEVPFEQLDIPVGPTTEQISLYEAVDKLIWEADADGVAAETRYLSHVAPILVLHLTNPDTSNWQLQVKVPGVWYLDRYMAENTETTRQMRRNRAEFMQEIQSIDEKIKSLQHWKPAGGSTVYEVDGLLGGASNYLARDPDSIDEEADEMDTTDDGETERSKALSTRLQKVFDQLHSRIEALGEEKKSIEQKLDQLSSVLKPQSLSPEDTVSFKHKYILRGVCTKPNNVYLPVVAQDGNTETWWKMEYEPTPSIEKKMVSLEEVLENANRESRDVLLVYASESACSAQDITIPSPLLDFVKNDNLEFKEARRTSEIMGTGNGWQDTAAPDYDNDPPPYGYNEMQPEYTNGNGVNEAWVQDSRWSPDSTEATFDEEMRRETHKTGLPSVPEKSA